MTNMHFCPKGPAVCKISQEIVMKWGNSGQENFQMISFLVSFKSYRCFMSSLKFIHSLFSPRNSQKGPFLSLLFLFNSLLKHVLEIVIAPQLEKMRPSSVKIREHRTHGIQQQQSIVDIFLHIYILLKKSFPLIY